MRSLVTSSTKLEIFNSSFQLFRLRKHDNAVPSIVKRSNTNSQQDIAFSVCNPESARYMYGYSHCLLFENVVIITK